MDEDLRSRFKYRSRPTSSTGTRPHARPVNRPVLAEAPIQTEVKKPKKPRGKRFWRKKWLIVVVIIVVVLAIMAVAGSFAYKAKKDHDQSEKNKHSVSAKTSFPGISFQIYYPSNLPSGYKFNDDAKVLKDNVLFYSVTDPEGKTYYVTLQPIPPAFNYATFNDKFLKPHMYTTNIGSVVAGQVGPNLIGSIQTSNNVWIIINADSKNPQSSLETITRSFEATK